MVHLFICFLCSELRKWTVVSSRALKHGDDCNYKGADRDAALSILLQDTLTCSSLMVFCAGKAELGDDTMVSSHNLRGLLDWETCWESGEYPSITNEIQNSWVGIFRSH